MRRHQPGWLGPVARHIGLEELVRSPAMAAARIDLVVGRPICRYQHLFIVTVNVHAELRIANKETKKSNVKGNQAER